MRDWLTIRNGLGVALLVWFARLMQPFLDFHTPGLSDFAHALLAMSVLILAMILLSASFAEWFSRPFTGVIDAIYFGDNQAETPPVNLKLARIYRHELRYADAISECERQLEYHPRSLELWAEMICSARESGDAESAERFRRKALRRLKAEDRILLEREISSPDTWGRHGECKALR